MDGGHGTSSVERHVGSRFEQVEEEPVKASANRSGESNASARPQTATEPRVPRIGPRGDAALTFQASAGICFMPTTAPRKGMNNGAEAGTPLAA
jgi:hypothetical protein